jgi:hypothetical protein
MKRTALPIIAALLMACGSGSTTPAQANKVTGAASCTADQRQDLTFSGYLSGHITCAASSPTCVRGTGPLLPFAGLASRLSIRTGDGKPVQILIIFQIDPVDPGSYPAGPVGNESTSTPTGVTLDGIGHWTTQSGGGTIFIDRLTASGATGRLDVQLFREADTFTLRGTWRCAGSPGPLAAA